MTMCNSTCKQCFFGTMIVFVDIFFFSFSFFRLSLPLPCYLWPAEAFRQVLRYRMLILLLNSLVLEQLLLVLQVSQLLGRVKPLQLRKGRVKKKTDMKAKAHLVTLWHYGNCTTKCWAAVEQAWIQSCQCLGKGWLEIFYVAYFICLLDI